MKIRPSILLLLLACASPSLTSCATARKQPPAPAAASDGKSVAGGKSVAAKDDDLEEYDSTDIPDPLEPLNRGSFWLNHQIYRYLLRPVARTYRTVVPKPVRTGVYNVFDNIEFPVRFINDSLQGNFHRAGLETGRFLVNSTAGVGGIMRVSDRIPALANVPDADTGQTLAKWGIPHGAYLVWPIIGPSSTRETVGLAGDYAMNPITWVAFFYGSWAWTVPVSVADTVSFLPNKFDAYDTAVANALDPYLAVRSAYVQYRKEIAEK